MQRFPLMRAEYWGDIDAFIGFAVGMIAGAIIYLNLPFEPRLSSVVIGMVAICIVTIWGLRQAAPMLISGMGSFVCGVAAGLLAGSFSAERTQHVTIAAPTGPILLEGWVVAAEPAERGVRLRINVHSIDGLAKADTPNKVRVTHILSLNTEPGRFVRCWVVLRPPPQPIIAGDYDFARQAWFSGLGAVGYVQGRCRGGALGPPQNLAGRFALSIAQKRRQLARYVNGAAGERAGGFAAALASGDRSYMRAEDQEALRRSGLAHLLAISGLHMGIVGGLVFLALWRGFALIEPIALRISVKKPAAFGALMACASYLVISGGSISTQRAFIMSAIIFGAVIWDRKALSMRSLALAIIIVLAMAPWSVLTPGFQMSFAATAALVATYEAWRKRRRLSLNERTSRLSFWFKSLVVTSTVSSLATAPFALYHFDRFAGLGLIANLFAMPIISLISAPMAGAALILAPLHLDGIALRGFGLSLEWVLQVAHTFSGQDAAPSPRLPQMPWASLVVCSIAILLYALSVSRLAKALVLGVAFGASGLIWAVSAKDQVHWSPSGDLFFLPAFGQAERWHIRDGEGLSPLRLNDLSGRDACIGEQACELSVKDFVFQLKRNGNDSDDVDSISVRIRSDAFQPGVTSFTMRWQSVLSENGVTLHRQGDALIQQAKPKCGRRPWRPCSVS